MYVYPVVGNNANVTMSSFQQAIFQPVTDTTIGQGLNNAQSGFTNVLFPLYPAQPAFDVTPYDSISNPAQPDDTATVNATGLEPNTTYQIKWVGSDGTTTTQSIITDSLGAYSGDPLTVPTTITGPTTYTAYLIDPSGQTTQADSFIALTNNATLPWGSVGDAYNGTYTQTIPAGATQTYSATGLPAGLSIDPSTGAITGTPTAAGTYSVTFTSTVTYADGTTGTFTSVRPITITDSPLPAGQVGTAYSETPVSTGLPAGATVSSITDVTNLPAGLTWDAAAQKITGTPTAAGTTDNVQVTYTVTLADGTTKTQTDTVPLTINPATTTQADTNQPAYQATAVDQGATATVPAPTNADGTPLPTGTTFAADPAGTVPAWATVNPDGTITVAPDASVPLGTTDIPVLVTYPDGTSEVINETVTVMALVANPSPTDAQNNQPAYNATSVEAGQTATVVPPVNADGTPAPAGTTFAVDPAATNVPTWATVNPDGSITAKPDTTVPAGQYVIPVLVAYPDSSSETINATVTVTPAQTQTTPTTTPTDADSNTPGYYSGQGAPGDVVPMNQVGDTTLPAGTTFTSDNPVFSVDPTTGTITATVPAGAKPGDVITGTISATYPDGSKDTIPVQITVTQPATTPTPAATPTIGAIADQTVVAGSPMTPVTVTVNNLPAGGSYEVSGLPTGVTFNPATGTISGSPAAAGTYPITITVKDAQGNTVVDANGQPVTETFVLTATAPAPVVVSPLPTITLGADQTVAAGTPITPIPVTVSGLPTGGKVDVNGLPTGVTYNPATGAISGTPTVPGTYVVTVHVLDAQGNVITDASGNPVAKTVTITVTGTPTQNPGGDTGATPTDADNNNPGYLPADGAPGATVTLPQGGDTQLPAGTSFTSDNPAVVVNPTTGEVTVKIPADAQPGTTITDTITVTYPDGSKDVAPFSVTVTAPAGNTGTGTGTGATGSTGNTGATGSTTGTDGSTSTGSADGSLGAVTGSAGSSTGSSDGSTGSTGSSTGSADGSSANDILPIVGGVAVAGGLIGALTHMPHGAPAGSSAPAGAPATAPTAGNGNASTGATGNSAGTGTTGAHASATHTSASTSAKTNAATSIAGGAVRGHSTSVASSNGRSGNLAMTGVDGLALSLGGAAIAFAMGGALLFLRRRREQKES